MAEFDNGLLVINGVGNHPPTQTLEAIVEPLLARMRAEGVLVDSFARELGEKDQPGGVFDAIEVKYQPKPPAEEMRRLLIVEGRWQGLYRRADAPQMSAWIYARQTGMVWEVVRYLSRSFGGLLLSTVFAALCISAAALAGWDPSSRWMAGVILAAAVGVGVGAVSLEPADPSPQGEQEKDTRRLRRAKAAVPNFLSLSFPSPAASALFLPVFVGLLVLAIQAIDGSDTRPAWLLLSALGVALGTSFHADVDVGGIWTTRTQGVRSFFAALVEMIVSASLFLVYTTMRVAIVAAAAMAIVVFLVVTPLIRLLASVPFTSKLRWWLFSKFETALFTGGFADMESVLNNHVSAAAMRTRLRKALSETRSGVRKEGVITVVVHSGGAPLAWDLLSSDALGSELAVDGTGHRFKLVTVGAALNWARRGLNDRRATRIDRPLVSGGPALDHKTAWLNIYSAWDPTPHGPLTESEWPSPWKSMFPHEVPPHGLNLQVRNLGAPVREEHQEYWANQEQVVPILGWAIDEEIEWSERNSRPEWRTHWAAVRAALVSTLVRVRLVLVTCIIWVFMSLLTTGGDAFQFVLIAPDNIPVINDVQVFGISQKEALCADNTYGFDNGNVSTSCQLVQRNDKDGKVQQALEYLSEHDRDGSIVAVAGTLVLAYLVMNLYTTLFWSQLARGPLPFGARGPTDTRDNHRFPWILTPAVVIVVPFVLSLAVLAFTLPLWSKVSFIAGTTLVGFCECGWLWASVKAAKTKDDPGKWRAYRRPLGRALPQRGSRTRASPAP